MWALALLNSARVRTGTPSASLAFIAQLIALPLADKLQLKAEDEARNQVLITTSMRTIMRGENPRVMTELLSSFVTPEQRNGLAPEREA